MLRKLFYNLAYLRHPVWDTGISPHELLDFIKTHTPGKALDMGCGTGTNAITLAKHGWQVTGVDFSRRAIQIATQKAQQHQVRVDLYVEDVSKLADITGPFDLILDIGCYHSLPAGDRQAYITNVERLLANHGTYLLYTFIRTSQEAVGPGASDTELQLIHQKLRIVERTDGTERGIRPSAWLTIQKRR
jgi:cyclopropane fatty-acyl-phospholipid synthase-like methyltransferase